MLSDIDRIPYPTIFDYLPVSLLFDNKCVGTKSGNGSLLSDFSDHTNEGQILLHWTWKGNGNCLESFWKNFSDNKFYSRKRPEKCLCWQVLKILENIFNTKLCLWNKLLCFTYRQMYSKHHHLELITTVFLFPQGCLSVGLLMRNNNLFFFGFP